MRRFGHCAATILLLAAVSGAGCTGATPDRPFPQQVAPQASAGVAVAVLATPHLRRTPEGFGADHLEPILGRLESFAPDRILIEKLPARQIAAFEALGGAHQGVAERFAGVALTAGAAAREALGTDRPQAAQAAEEWLGESRGEPVSASSRRRGAALLAAAYEWESALLQWRRLRPAERRADLSAGVSSSLADLLDAGLGEINETTLLSVELAARLGHDRLYPVDDWSVGPELSALGQRLAPAITDSMVMTELMASEAFVALQGVSARLTDPQATLQVYRQLNDADHGLLDARLQWGSFARADLPDDLGATRVGLWETRNFHMVGHIRRALAEIPRGRALVVVGASHKPFFDAYLASAIGVHTVDTAELLASETLP